MQVRARLAVPAVLVALSLSGCRHASGPAGTGSSTFRLVEPPSTPPPTASAAEASEPAARAQYREASVIEKSVVLPDYPARALAARAGAAQVGAKVTVDTEGRVVDVRPSLLAVTIAPPGFTGDFEQAVETAVRRWRFHPARAEYIETVTSDGFSYQRVTRTEMLEAEFDLVFTFTPSGKVEANGTR